MIVATIMTLYVLPAISHLLLKKRGKAHATGEYDDCNQLGSPLPAK